MSTFSAIIDTGLTSAEGFNKTLSQLLIKGVASIGTPTSLQAIQRAAGANMSVDISVGSALLSNTSGTFGYAVWQDGSPSNPNVTISASNPSNPRIDAVIAYINLAAISTTQNNNPGSLVFTAIAGTPAGSPTTPTDSTIQAALGAGVPWIRLANVTVDAAATQIVTAKIADARPPFAVRARLWGGTANTSGHTVPNVADDTVMILGTTSGTAQSPSNLTISGTTNKVRAGGANSSLVDSNGIQIDLESNGVSSHSNYVASGCVWTGDSYGSTLAASMTSGVVYIAGRRLTVSAVTSRAFTASKDTYVDFQDNGDGTAKIVYTEVSNNTSSPAIPNSLSDATNVRNAIIITGTTNILNAGSINQGQETAVLPISASVAYSVVDSIGNLICPRDPQRKLLGMRQLLSNFSGSATSATDVTGLSMIVTVPQGRKLKLTTDAALASGGTSPILSIYDGTAGTALQQSNLILGPVHVSYITTPPSAGTRTYTLRYSVASGTLTISAGSTFPFYFSVELD